MTHSDKKPQYFGTDGIRGRVGQAPLLPDFVMRLGYAAGVVLARAIGKPTFIIGRDTRQSGQLLQSALTAGMLASGATVMDIGVIPTPGVAFMVRKLGASAGVVISASHNPVAENGIKFFNAAGMKLNEEIELQIEALLETPMDLHTMQACDFGHAIDGSDMRELYVDSLVSEHHGLDLGGITLVLDCANGAASWYAPECFSRLGAKVFAVGASPTGININEHAGSEHVRQSPQEMAALIHQYQANFGLAFDGDADRVIFVDENGQLVDGDHILAILAEYLQAHERLLGKSVVSTIMVNGGLVKHLKDAGFQFIETPVGDKYVMEELVKLHQMNSRPRQIGLGGEQSGHVILLDDQHSTGDGIRAGIYLVRALLDSGKKRLADLAATFAKYPQVIGSATVAAKPKLDEIDGLQPLMDALKTDLPGLQRSSLRYSGTEPKVRLMLEADTRHSEADLAEKAWQICTLIQKATNTPEDAPLEVLNVSRGGFFTRP